MSHIKFVVKLRRVILVNNEDDVFSVGTTKSYEKLRNTDRNVTDYVVLLTSFFKREGEGERTASYTTFFYSV